MAFIFVVLAGLLLLGSCRDDPAISNEYDSGSPFDPDSSLPDGFISKNRPPNPPTTFKMPCPVAETKEPFTNPYLIIDGFPEGIHAIDAPEFISVTRAASSIQTQERIIAVDHNGEVRGFPVKILLYHELVNLCWEDSTGLNYSFVTYCPLVDGRYLAFSFLGSDENGLPLYEDAETGSLWTFDGIAVRGVPHLRPPASRKALS